MTNAKSVHRALSSAIIECRVSLVISLIPCISLSHCPRLPHFLSSSRSTFQAGQLTRGHWTGLKWTFHRVKTRHGLILPRFELLKVRTMRRAIPPILKTLSSCKTHPQRQSANCIIAGCIPQPGRAALPQIYSFSPGAYPEC